MAEQIENGGSGVKIGMHVDKNEQAHVFALNRTVNQDAVRKGNAYNLNTGTIGLTSTTASGVFYFKNNESPVNGESSFIIDALVIGIDNQGTQAGACIVTVVRNPTGGTLISNAVDVDMNQNRNFGSSNTLDSLVYKGVEGDTITGGSDIAIFYQNAGTRGYYTIDMEVPKGSSVAVKIDTQTTSGTTNLYVAGIGHRVDGNNS
jgi:hypothetical protein